jgi:hypothetical protein
MVGVVEEDFDSEDKDCKRKEASDVYVHKSQYLHIILNIFILTKPKSKPNSNPLQ